MAFCGKLGMLVRQNGRAPLASMLNSVRYMSEPQTNLFIGGLSYGVDDGSLKEAFSGFGDVIQAKVVVDRDTGRSRGFGFIKFADSESASSAMSSVDGQELNGRVIRVSFASHKPTYPRSYGGGNYRGFRGGYGGGNDGY